METVYKRRIKTDLQLQHYIKELNREKWQNNKKHL
jgi:hypothetical protein